MYYTVYKITNQINGKIYIGTHKTEDLNDNYMGSGKYLKYSQEKHGIENFNKEILFVFDNPEDMYDKEAEIVNEEFIAEENTYNLKVGGFGGWDYVNNGSPESIANKIKAGKKADRTNALNAISYLMKNDSEWRQNLIKKRVASWKKTFENIEYAFSGKNHTEETKRKIGEANSKHQSGSGNSQYGKMWIYNNELCECKKINKGDLIPEGWYKGRKMKFNRGGA